MKKSIVSLYDVRLDDSVVTVVRDKSQLWSAKAARIASQGPLGDITQ